MSNEELDSQLSAMFDDELPQAECELLARRLSRDPQLKARWGRYALISMAVRGERTVRLDADLARRVSVALASEPVLDQDARTPAGTRPAAFGRWRQAAAGVGLAAGVAALSIFFLRAQNGGTAPDVLVADQDAATVMSPAAVVGSPEPDRYTVPTVADSPAIVPTAELANYVVAHSEFATPLVRRNTLATLMASDAAALDESDATLLQQLEQGGDNDAQNR
jgi:sigma-E factor negative regulatory protein RseA